MQINKDNYKVLGILIRSNRINKGYSLRDLGELTNISHTLISNIENGKQVPSTYTLKDIFDVLDLDFHDDEQLHIDFKTKAEQIYNFLYTQDYDEATVLIEQLTENENLYLYSPDVVNYVLLRSLYYAITEQKNSFLNETIEHYGKMTDFFSENQRQIFVFAVGLDHLNHERYNKATESFYNALSMGTKELDVFINQYNVISLVRQYKFIDAYRIALTVIKEFEDRTIYIRAMKTKLQVARIFYNIAKNDEVYELTEYVERFASKYHVDELLEECIMLRTAIEIRNRNFDYANSLIETMPNKKSVTTVLLKFKIAFTQNNLADIEEYFKEISSYEGITSHEKVWNYLQIQAMSRIKSLYDKDLYLQLINRLVEISTTNNDQEMIGLSYNYLIMHYHEERSYKKALELAETLLHFKKIRIESE